MPKDKKLRKMRAIFNRNLSRSQVEVEIQDSRLVELLTPKSRLEYGGVFDWQRPSPSVYPCMQKKSQKTRTSILVPAW
jgi:hypothetical protein